MPVNSGVLRQVIGDENTDPITLERFYGWPRRAAVVAPALGRRAWRKLMLNFLGDQTELFDPVFHFKRQR